MAALIYFVFGLAISLYSCDAYRALVVFPMPATSHSILGAGVITQLLKDGNEVVYISGVEYKGAHPNLRVIDVSVTKEVIPDGALSIKTLLENKFSISGKGFMKGAMTAIAAKVLDVKAVKDLLSDPKEEFDVVIVEWLFSEILSGLAPVFGCPHIWLSPMEVNPDILKLIDAMPNPSYNADILSTISPPFTFLERIDELKQRIVDAYLDYMYFDNMQAEIYNKGIAPYIEKRNRKAPSFHEVKLNSSLILGNSYVAMGEATAIPPSYKHLGGYYIDDSKPLPEDLKKIMDSAKNGVIYFSMGSNLKSKDWPEEIKQKLLKVFGNLPQTVLWKFEEDLPNVPKNVHILKWAPQPSILAHPNCLLFISHGGLLSTTETIHLGVPIIGIPVFGDQFYNVQRAVNKGFALREDLTYNVADQLIVAIKEMTSNPKYRSRVKELSQIYHDRPVKAKEELSHWVRHVVDTSGALHLRSPALYIPLYQRLYLDLIGLVLLALILKVMLLKCLFTALFSKKTVSSKKKKN